MIESSPESSTSKKRKLEELQNPEHSNKQLGIPSSSQHSTTDTSNSQQAKKNKKNQDNSRCPQVFAFNSAELRSRQQPVAVTDLRNIILSVAEHTPTQNRPNFITAPGKQAVKRIAVLCIPGITPDTIGMSTPPAFTVTPSQHKLHPRSLFAGPAAKNVAAKQMPLDKAPAFPLAVARGAPETQLPAMSRLFSHGLPTRAEGEGGRLYDPVNSLLMGPAKIVKKDDSKPDSSLFGEQSTTLEALLLSPSELAKEGLETLLKDTSEHIPKGSPSLHRIANGWGLSRTPAVDTEGWVEAPPLSISISPEQASSRENSVVLALDCEMVNVAGGSGKGLARIAVVDFWTEELLMDELVKPTEEIIDYLTQWSGITETMLKFVTTDLADIQSRLIGMMKSSNAILIGHHISNDLQALRLAHTRCIDTSVIYHNLQRPSAKPSLKWLAQRWLGREIQAQGQTATDGKTGQEIVVLGHRPEEDARACVSLVKMKVEQGIAFGKTNENKTSIFQRIKAAGMSTAYVGGAANSYGTLATTAVDCGEDQVLDNVAELLQTHDFVFGRVHFLADKLGWTTPHDTSSPEHPSTKELQQSRAAALEALNQQLKDFHTSLPSQTAVILYTGCSDPRPVGALNRRKAVWDAKIRSGLTADQVPQDEQWAAEDVEALDKECEATKAGLAFFCISLLP